MSDTKGKFSSLPPSSAALAGHHLLESQNALTNASLQKRELAKETTGIMGDVRLKLADAIKESLEKEAQKQFVSGGMAIGGGALSLGMAGYTGYENNKMGKDVGPLTDKKVKNQKMADELRNTGPVETRLSKKDLNDPNNPVKKIMDKMAIGDPEALTGIKTVNGTTTIDANTKQAMEHLKDGHVSGTRSDYAVAIERYENRAQTLEKEINSKKTDVSNTAMTNNMIKDGVNSFLTQGITGIVGGALDMKKADIDYNKVLRELTNQQLTEDRRLFTENASKYQGDASKSLDLLNQIRANNRYG